jgi:hypothetical protein
MRRVSGAGSLRAVAVALCAATCALATACSSASPADSSSAKQPTAQQAITLAADETGQVNLLAGDISIQAGSAGSVSGTLQMQVRPSFLMGVNLNAALGAESGSISEILTTTALYMQIPGLSAITNGEPWAEIPFSELSGSLGTTLSQALQDVQESNPLAQAQLFATSKLVHKVGTQVINGISTTQYAGSVSPSAALAALPASESKQLAPVLKMISGDIGFDVWIDDSHVVRKLTENETVSGQAIATTVTITSVNQPLTVSIPPASQVYVLPASLLSGSGSGLTIGAVTQAGSGQ